jgi:hypothetical protein
VGKTTLMKALVGRFGFPAIEQEKPIPHIVYPNNAIQLGRQRLDFGGTDALAMSIQPKALAFLRTKPAAVVVGEGDRLGNRKFIMDVGVFADVRLVWLVGHVYAEARRQLRNHIVGKSQDEMWLKGRVTKVANLADLVTLRVDAGLHLDIQVDEVWNEVIR